MPGKVGEGDSELMKRRGMTRWGAMRGMAGGNGRGRNVCAEGRGDVGRDRCGKVR